MAGLHCNGERGRACCSTQHYGACRALLRREARNDRSSPTLARRYVIPPGTDYGLNLNETTLPELLRASSARYQTAAIGKARGGVSVAHCRPARVSIAARPLSRTPQWHLGMSTWAQTPTFRGYDYFHGFYSGGQVRI